LIEALSARTTWPTPTVCGNYNRKGASATSGDGLATAVLKCATPTARDWKSGKASQATHDRNSRPLSEQIGGSLNPTWVETLMGWCIGWTDLKPMSHVKMCFWLMGFIDGAERRAGEVLRVLRSGHAAEEVRNAIGRSVSVSEAAFLLADLCEHQNRPDEARIFMACAQALEADVRGMRIQEGASSTPHRSGQGEQRAEQHPDAMQALSRLLAFSGAQAWQDGSFEDAIPRVADGVAARVDRLKAIGNGQVPLCAATAWRMLTA
jgi:hypothetical protein